MQNQNVDFIYAKQCPFKLPFAKRIRYVSINVFFVRFFFLLFYLTHIGVLCNIKNQNTYYIYHGLLIDLCIIAVFLCSFGPLFVPPSAYPHFSTCLYICQFPFKIINTLTHHLLIYTFISYEVQK